MTKEQIEIIDLLIDRCQNEKFLAAEVKALKEKVEHFETTQTYLEFYCNLQTEVLVRIEKHIDRIATIESEVEEGEDAMIDYESFTIDIAKVIKDYNKQTNEGNY
jgi:hypothetical protein